MGAGGFGFTKLTETTNAEYLNKGRQTLGAKILSQEGNSPECIIRSLISIE